MRIIPVLDLIGGLVVCGQKGERSKYQPIRSIFCNSADPLEIVKAMKPKELYIADLDAIEMKGSNLDIIHKIKFYNDIFLIVDAGFKSLLEVNNYLAAGIDKIIFGTETLTDINLLKQANEKFGREKILVSIDVKNGKTLSKIQEFQHISPIKLATYMQHFVHELILLDISKVGTLVGSDTNLVRSIVKAVDVPIIVGGGIKGIQELRGLKKLGVNGALIGTALHMGLIPKKVLLEFDSLFCITTMLGII